MNVIAKRYVDALVEGASIDEVTLYASVFTALTSGLNDDKVNVVFHSPYMSKEQQVELLLAATSSAKSEKIDNLIKLLVAKNRTKAISTIANVLELTLEQLKNSYAGVVESNISLDKATCKTFSDNFSKKANSTIALELEKSDYNGIKMSVDSLGLEVGLSKTVVRDQMIQHILKSI